MNRQPREVIKETANLLETVTLVRLLEEHAMTVRVFQSGVYVEDGRTEADLRRFLTYLKGEINSNRLFKKTRLHRDEPYENVLKAIKKSIVDKDARERAARAAKTNYEEQFRN